MTWSHETLAGDYLFMPSPRTRHRVRKHSVVGQELHLEAGSLSNGLSVCPSHISQSFRKHFAFWAIFAWADCPGYSSSPVLWKQQLPSRQGRGLSSSLIIPLRWQSPRWILWQAILYPLGAWNSKQLKDFWRDRIEPQNHRLKQRDFILYLMLKVGHTD